MPDEIPQPLPCPADCPNRSSGGGLNLDFGKAGRLHLDTIELFACAMLLLPSGIMIKDAFTNPDYGFDQAAKNVMSLIAIVGAVKVLPTSQLSDWLSVVKVGK